MDLVLDALKSVGFNAHVAMFNFINFVIVFFILKKFFFKKIGDTIENRDTIIKKGLSDAKEAELALATATEEKENILHAAKSDGKAIVQKYTSDAEREAVNIKAKATKEADDLVSHARGEADRIQDKLEKEIAAKTPALVNEMVKNILKTKNNESLNNDIVKNILA